MMLYKNRLSTNVWMQGAERKNKDDIKQASKQFEKMRGKSITSTSKPFVHIPGG